MSLRQKNLKSYQMNSKINDFLPKYRIKKCFCLHTCNYFEKVRQGRQRASPAGSIRCGFKKGDAKASVNKVHSRLTSGRASPLPALPYFFTDNLNSKFRSPETIPACKKKILVVY